MQKLHGLIDEIYSWFNHILNPNNPFEKRDLEKYFTPKFILKINNEIEADNYDLLFEHFNNVRKVGFKKIEIIFPLEEIIISPDNKKSTTKYNMIRIGSDDKQKLTSGIAIWHISEDFRLDQINQIIAEVESIIDK